MRYPDSADPLHPRRIAELEPQRRRRDLRRRLGVEAVEPDSIGIRAVLPDIFEDGQHFTAL